MRLLATILVLLALVAQSAATVVAAPHERTDAAGPAFSCKAHAAAGQASRADDDAPIDDAVHDHSNCALYQIGWTILPAAEAFRIELATEAERAAPPLSFSTTPVFRFNVAAPPRGPPSFA